jgi:hypothetical protein
MRTDTKYPLLNDIEYYIEDKIKEFTQNRLEEKGLICQLILNLERKYKVERIEMKRFRQMRYGQSS